MGKVTYIRLCETTLCCNHLSTNSWFHYVKSVCKVGESYEEAAKQPR